MGAMRLQLGDCRARRGSGHWSRKFLWKKTDNLIVMRQLLLNLLIFAVIGAGAYVGLAWSRQQAFLFYSQQFIQEVDETVQIWNRQVGYPLSRQWLNNLIYQRRWEILNEWGKQLIDYDQKLNLHTEFIQAIEKFLQAPTDFRDFEKVKFYALELKQRSKRLPKSQIARQKRLMAAVAGDLEAFKGLLQEHKLLINKKVTPQLASLEMALRGQQGQQQADVTSYCQIHKSVGARQSILEQMKAKCGEPANAKLPLCEPGAQSKFEELQKLEQASLDRVKQQLPQGREPACVP